MKTRIYAAPAVKGLMMIQKLQSDGLMLSTGTLSLSHKETLILFLLSTGRDQEVNAGSTSKQHRTNIILFVLYHQQ